MLEKLRNVHLQLPISYDQVQHRTVAALRKGIWVYFLLLIFEGALRKWFLPFLAAPLLIVRDPVAIWLLYTAWRNGLLPSTGHLRTMVVIAILSTFAAIFFGHGSILVAAFGARIFLIHYPLIFLIGKFFNRDDVLMVGKYCLWLSVPMTFLISLQFYSPQSAWVNHVAGGIIEEIGFQGALGHFRPPGTFSFITGVYLFYGLVTCYIMYFWLNTKNVNKLILIGATLSVLAAIPFSISRTLLFEVCITIIFAFIAVSRKPKFLGKMVGTVAVAFVALMILSKTSFFQHATETFFSRFTNASETEGGVEGTLVDRFIGSLVTAVTGAFDLPFFGYGLGLGTNVGSQLMAGKRVFLLHEEEWKRVIDEMGALLGLSVTFIRLSLTTKISVACYGKLKSGDILPWLLLSLGAVCVATGNWAQPTSLGFCTFIGGLMIASLNSPRQPKVIA